MKKIFMLIISVMFLLTNIAMSNPQQVELNDTYSVEQTRVAANALFSDNVKFYTTMSRCADPNNYVRSYFAVNLEDWLLVIDQNGQGNVCQILMSVPDSTNELALGTIGDVMLTIACGAESEYYDFSSAEKKLIWKARNAALEEGIGIFYCEDTKRFYVLSVSHDKMDNVWYYSVKAYVN